LTGVLAASVLAKVFEPAPVYSAPSYAYYASPVIVPPPVVYAPPPRVIVYRQPVYVQPSPVVYARPTPVVAYPRYYRTAHRHYPHPRPKICW
jgi:hypothetical protein